MRFFRLDFRPSLSVFLIVTPLLVTIPLHFTRAQAQVLLADGSTLDREKIGNIQTKLQMEEAELLKALKEKSARSQFDTSETSVIIVGGDLSDKDLEGEELHQNTTFQESESQMEEDSPQVAPNTNIDALEGIIREHKREVANIHHIKSSLQEKIQSAESRIEELTRKLEDTKEKLLLAETEVNRLSKIIEQRNIQTVRSLRSSSKETFQKANLEETSSRYGSQSASTAPVIRGSSRQKSPSLPIATITVQKANLRTGPGLQHSVLLTVAEDSRLVVEKRQGAWYRIIAPTGERAWVSSDVVSFSSGENSESDVVKVRGIYDQSLEDRREVFSTVR